jgi:polygalacturonase
MKYVLVSFFALLTQITNGQDYNICSYGAKADGGTINTKYIQQAIDDCNKNSGGSVIIPPGVFVTGTIFLKSHVTLYLQKGAVLKGSSNLEDYKKGSLLYGLIYASDEEDVSIAGEGEINGNSSWFMFPDKLHTFVDYDAKYTRQGDNFMKALGIGDGPIAHKERPDMMIIIKHSSRVKISGLHLTNSPNWTIRIGECENVQINNLMILNDRLIPNNDGIHCTTSRNVIISNCNIECGDDGIIVSGFGDETGVGGYTEKVMETKHLFGNNTKITENITVSNCIIASSSAAIRIGYGMNNIRNCTFENIIIHNSNRGILVQCRDDMTIEHLKFSHIIMDTRLFTGCWWGKGEPIHISAMPQNGTHKVGKINDVQFSDISINYTEAGIILFAGDSISSIDNIQMENISITLSNGKNSKNFGGNIDLRPTDNYATSLYKFDIPALYAHNLKHLSLKNFTVSWKDSTDFFKEAIRCEHVYGLDIQQFSGRQAAKNGVAIVLEDARQVAISNCKAPEGTDLFLMENKSKLLQFFLNNDLSRAKRLQPLQLKTKFKVASGNILPVK